MERLQIIIASTGRSGTTWLQLLMADLYNAAALGARGWKPETGLFVPAATGSKVNHLVAGAQGMLYRTWPEFWSYLPGRAVVNAHWHAYPEIVEELQARGVPVVTLARHPFDIAISHLAWVNRYDQVNLDIDHLKGLAPTSPGFVDFASGELAQWLFSITRGWWTREWVHRVRYEELVARPLPVLAQLAEEIGAPPALSVEDTLARDERRGLRTDRLSRWARIIPGRHRDALLDLWSGAVRKGGRGAYAERQRQRKHYWQGRPGLWRSLLPAEQAEEIGRAHAELLEFFGYDCDPDPALTPGQADANWRAMMDAG
ncbi:MAG: hypothetical protein GEU28_07150 [Dehalococcoidia bacterium]|nr:hypothetical protein [Dehalococcoidia bacterium]